MDGLADSIVILTCASKRHLMWLSYITKPRFMYSINITSLFCWGGANLIYGRLTLEHQCLPEPVVHFISVQFSSVTQLCPTLFDRLDCSWPGLPVHHQLLEFMSIASVMPPNHLILCRPLLLPPSIFPSIRVFSNKSVLHIRWPKYWSFSLESLKWVI